MRDATERFRDDLSRVFLMAQVLDLLEKASKKEINTNDVDKMTEKLQDRDSKFQRLVSKEDQVLVLGALGQARGVVGWGDSHVPPESMRGLNDARENLNIRIAELQEEANKDVEQVEEAVVAIEESVEINKAFALAYLMTEAHTLLNDAIRNKATMTHTEATEFWKRVNQQLETPNPDDKKAVLNAISDAANLIGFSGTPSIELSRQASANLDVLDERIKAQEQRIAEMQQKGEKEEEQEEKVVSDEDLLNFEEIEQVLDEVVATIDESQEQAKSFGEWWKTSGIGKFFAGIGNWLKGIKESIKEAKKSMQEAKTVKVSTQQRRGVFTKQDRLLRQRSGSLAAEKTYDRQRIAENNRLVKIYPTKTDNPRLNQKNEQEILRQQAENDIFYFKLALKEGEEVSVDIGKRIKEIREQNRGESFKEIEINMNLNELEKLWNEKKPKAKEEVEEKPKEPFVSPVTKFFIDHPDGTLGDNKEDTLHIAVFDQAHYLSFLLKDLDGGGELPEDIDDQIKSFEKDLDDIKRIVLDSETATTSVKEHWGEGMEEERGKAQINILGSKLEKLKAKVEDIKQASQEKGAGYE